jgi:2-polyprenyl-3-methyl-5-hydroxy-6-metoxy-1,4-benzoquinol methylase
MNLQQRSNTKELLDGDHIPFAAILVNMQELNTINTLLGGHAITLEGFMVLAGRKKAVHICEIGCGGGDNLVAIVKYARTNNINLHLTGIDIKPECIEVARGKDLLHNAELIVSDYQTVSFATKPDIIFSSLFCHHFSHSQLIEQVQWMKENAAIGFFINDLQRNWLAYHSIKILTQLFSSSYLVKHDAPLSVARGFHKKEWMGIFIDANIDRYTIQWKWAFRYLIVVKN